jgi:UDP-glucose:(glucosyl)LPS alpha-1,2-glucosyltransferase
MEIFAGEVRTNEISEKSKGGSELVARRMAADLDKTLLKEFQIIVSRVRNTLDPTKIRVLLLQDLPEDPESHHLRNDGWRKFHRIVFVSHWQRERYVKEYGIPYSRTVVIHNAVHPIDNTGEMDKKKAKEKKINIIYHTTPHRGLEILVPVFEKLTETHKDIHLDVFSSFEMYGWKDRDNQYAELFDVSWV